MEGKLQDIDNKLQFANLGVLVLNTQQKELKEESQDWHKGEPLGTKKTNGAQQLATSL